MRMVEILPIAREHLDGVVALEQECFSSPWSLNSFLAELENPMAVFYVALLEGQVVGYAGMHHVLDEGQITNVAVTAGCRGRGVGKGLVGALMAYAKEHELCTVTLEVRVSNHTAIGLYDGYGFVQVGVRRGYYLSPTEDALLMTAEL